MDVLTLIKTKEAERRDKKIFPTGVLLSEIKNTFSSDPLPELRLLYKQGLVGYYKTLNQIAFYTNE